ncbi:hypothetical protein EVAR_24749_1 [Eumeta japonica]|uniref:Uncharacterized protein n=1 Tax=Eumeta variegata TaxID=151549 RepID=A0A4C1VD68_EUMVA|nr:hypothetical protein EVAR_24749_1 [Eumeta japonica]
MLFIRHFIYNCLHGNLSHFRGFNSELGQCAGAAAEVAAQLLSRAGSGRGARRRLNANNGRRWPAARALEGRIAPVVDEAPRRRTEASTPLKSQGIEGINRRDDDTGSIQSGSALEAAPPPARAARAAR